MINVVENDWRASYDNGGPTEPFDDPSLKLEVGIKGFLTHPHCYNLTTI